MGNELKPIKLECHKCKKFLGEIIKGKIANDVYLYCGNCQAQRDFNDIKNPSVPIEDYDLPKEFADIFGFNK